MSPTFTIVPDPEWLNEIERRSREFEEGKVKAIPWEEVKRELDRKYGTADE
jgi:putative addiction module component (TIGR02574 family)